MSIKPSVRPLIKFGTLAKAFQMFPGGGGEYRCL